VEWKTKQFVGKYWRTAGGNERGANETAKKKETWGWHHNSTEIIRSTRWGVTLPGETSKASNNETQSLPEEEKDRGRLPAWKKDGY